MGASFFRKERSALNIEDLFSCHPIRHFMTITEHRLLVMRGCFAVGLYWQGLTHDLSKYSPTEFIPGAIYYQGNRSPNNAEREAIGYSSAWLHHKGRNRHHYEYWLDYSSENYVNKNLAKRGVSVPVEMPKRYVIEMLMDRIAASKVYNKDKYTDDLPLKYFTRTMALTPMHKNTKKLLYALLRMLAVYGEKKTFGYIKRRLVNKNGR